MMDGTGIQPVYNVDGNNNNNGWGGNGVFGEWVILLFFLMAWGNGGWGGFGNGNGANSPALQGALTRGDLCSEFNFNNLERTAEATNRGICDLGFALNNSINGVNTNMLQGFAGVGNAICDLGFNMQQNFNAGQIALLQAQAALQAQLASCCCDTQRAIDNVNFNMSQNTCALTNQMNNNTRDIIESQQAGTRAILDKMCQDQIDNLRNENTNLRLQVSQQNQNSVIGAMIDASEASIIRRTGHDNPVNAVVVQPNTPVTFPYGCGYGYGPYGYNGYGRSNNCGCDCGCGC